MQIVEIKEPRDGFVYELPEGKIGYFEPDLFFFKSFENGYTISDVKGLKLIGKLGITHKLKDGKLVEIPRRDIEVGGVFDGLHKYCITFLRDNSTWSIVNEEGTVYSNLDTEEKIFEFIGLDYRLGTMGITHEIDWSKGETK